MGSSNSNSRRHLHNWGSNQITLYNSFRYCHSQALEFCLLSSPQLLLSLLLLITIPSFLPKITFDFFFILLFYHCSLLSFFQSFTNLFFPFVGYNECSKEIWFFNFNNKSICQLLPSYVCFGLELRFWNIFICLFYLEYDQIKNNIKKWSNY